MAQTKSDQHEGSASLPSLRGPSAWIFFLHARARMAFPSSSGIIRLLCTPTSTLDSRLAPALARHGTYTRHHHPPTFHIRPTTPGTLLCRHVLSPKQVQAHATSTNPSCTIHLSPDSCMMYYDPPRAHAPTPLTPTSPIATYQGRQRQLPTHNLFIHTHPGHPSTTPTSL